MNDMLMDIKNKIATYQRGELTKEQLSKWAENQYYCMLKGNYIILEQLKVYPFMKILSQVGIEENDVKDEYPCSEEDIANIYNIVEGSKEYAFKVSVGIPEFIFNTSCNDFFDSGKRSQVYQIRQILQQDRDLKNDNNIDVVKQFIDTIDASMEPVTLLDMLEQNIRTILQCRLNKNDFKLYPTNGGCDKDMTRLEHYLDCYLGERDINIFACYKNGECGISIGM